LEDTSGGVGRQFVSDGTKGGIKLTVTEIEISNRRNIGILKKIGRKRRRCRFAKTLTLRAKKSINVGESRDLKGTETGIERREETKPFGFLALT
jgi:hypothetical protein